MDKNLKSGKHWVRINEDSDALSKLVTSVNTSWSTGHECTSQETLKNSIIFQSSSMNDVHKPAVVQIARQQSTLIAHPAKKHQLQKVNQLSIDSTEYLRISKPRQSRTSNLSTKQVKCPTSSTNDVLTSSSTCPPFDLNIYVKRSDDDNQSQPHSPTSTSKESIFFQLSPNKEGNYEPHSQFTHNFHNTTYKCPPFSQITSPRTSKDCSSQNCSNQQFTQSKNIISDFNLESTSMKTRTRDDTLRRNVYFSSDQRLSHFSHRDIFSPIPSEHCADDNFRGTKQGTRHNLSGDDSAAGIRNRSCNFPAIRIEDYDNSAVGESRGTDNKKYVNTMNLSASTPGGIFTEENMCDRHNTASLNVPSPVVKCRTTEGRLIAAINDDLLHGPLSKFWSRSEGSLPLTLSDTDQHGVSNRNSTNNYTQSQNLMSQHLSRYMTQHTSLPMQTPANTHLESTVSKEHYPLAPKLHTELVSMSKLRLTNTPHVTDIKKNRPFLSPQPQRKYGPNH